MKKIRHILMFVISVFVLIIFSNHKVSAKELVGKDNIVGFDGKEIAVIEIYDNSEIVIGYRYGLRKVTLAYCEKGLNCEMNMYENKLLMESSAEKTYKNDKNELEVYRTKPVLEKGKEYKFIVQAYFGANESYKGTESVSTGFMLYYLEVNSGESHIKGTNNPNIEDEGLNTLMGDFTEIANTIVIPVLYVVMLLVLIVKGALLGVEIVKSADNPTVREEKVHALKWLFIGLAIGLLATSVIGVITGFFETIF